MRKLLSALGLSLCLLGPVYGQTLGETLHSTQEETRQMVSSGSIPQTWGGEMVAKDLGLLAATAAELEGRLSNGDARNLDKAQEEFLAAASRLDTSKVMLSPTDQAKVEQMLAKAEAVNHTLASLRLRFGGKAASVAGSLADIPLASEEDLGYLNVQDLLIDVRSALELSRTLQYGVVQQFRFTLTGGGPNNLDGLQVRRLQLAASALETELARVDDIRDTLPAWTKFYREYNRLGYPGTGSNVRQFDRVVARLHTFYAQLEDQ